MPRTSVSPLSGSQRQQRYRQARKLQSTDLSPEAMAALKALRTHTGCSMEQVVVAAAQLLTTALDQGGHFDPLGTFVPARRALLQNTRKPVPDIAMNTSLLSIEPSLEELADIAESVVRGNSRSVTSDQRFRMTAIVQELRHIVLIVSKEFQQQLTSPSAKELEAQLEKIASLADGVAEVIFQLPDFSREILNTVYHSQKGWDDSARKHVSLGLGRAPAELAASATGLTARQQLKGWRDGSVLGRVPPARPGRQRAFQRLIGDPRVFLADQVAQMIAREQGIGAVTADVGGPVYDTVARLWTLATGFHEENANLRHYVRRGSQSVKYLVKAQVVREQINQVELDLSGKSQVQRDPYSKKRLRIRLNGLQARLQTLQTKAHAALWDYAPEASA